MSVDIRFPNINAKTEAEQQIKSYLIQMVEQLNWALKNIDTSNNTVVVNPTARSLMPSSQNTATSASPEATFGSIKALIIKSADIVNAYYEEINRRLEGVYVAESDFGTFSEQTSQGIYETSTNINRKFTNIQEIIGQVDSKVEDVETNISKELQDLKTELETLNYSVVEVTANIKTGLLDEKDGIPIYGLEVGQKNKVNGVEVFNKFARFTAGRLSFYDQNGSEVAYISDYKLYITHAEITGTLKIGGYLVDTTNGLTFKWVGKG